MRMIPSKYPGIALRAGDPGLAGLFLGLAGVFLAGSLWLATTAEAAPRPPVVPGATYVGSDTCKGCHETEAREIERTPHGKILGTKLAKNELQGRGCESCHGPGSKHLEDQSNPANNVRLGGKGKKPAVSASELNDVCLQCHSKGKQIQWAGSPHESRDVACVTCHAAHQPHSEKYQLRLVKADRYDGRMQSLDAVEYDLCGQCHQVKAMQFQRSSHMPMTARGEGGQMLCGSCHNPHGTSTEKLIKAVSVNENCTTCHAQKRGPFLWEHTPVLENCLNCHSPHGSNNPTLLKVKLPRLCQQCHSAAQHPSRPYGQTQRYVFNKSCLNCHSNIHGSNHPSGIYFTR